MAKLIPVVLDYESFWSTDHSLTKMNPIEYVMHPDTEIISCAIKIGDAPTFVVFGEGPIRTSLACINWTDKLLIAHNNEGFDSMISAWRMGIKPAMWGCTLAMARPHHAKTAGGSLKALVEHYELGVKDATALVQTKGKHLRDFTPDEIEAMRKYNKADTDQCAALFHILLKKTPKDEMRLIDMTIRMLVEPQFEVDQELLRRVLSEEQIRKREAFVSLGKSIWADRNPIHAAIPADAPPEIYDVVQELAGPPIETLEEEVRKKLGSSAKFAEFLRSRGVEPPTKISPTTGKEAYALAKTDEAFVALKDHDDPLVSAAVCARLDVKSTLLETRIQAFLDASSAAGGRLPVTLKYYGADTTGRWSGWGYNPQNLPRVSNKPSDCLRNSLRAPEGFKIVVADLSGIELRVNHFLWKVPGSMALFRADPEKADLYKEFASDLYSVEKPAVSKEQRQVGKVAHLGLGFGAGATTFQKVAKLMAGITLSDDEATDVVKSWRTAHPEIVQGWKTCHASLPAIAQGARFDIDPWGMCHTNKEGIKTPKGIIRYPNLRQETTDEGKTEWVYGEGRNKARIYAGKITENIVQHLARGIIADNALAFRREFGLLPSLMVHDELVYVVPEADAEAALAGLQAIMRTPPVWWPQLVTWSEGDIGITYGETK